MLEIVGVGRTERGFVRSRNEDAILGEPDLGLYVVCDGMGGHAGGDVAAATAIATIEQSVREQRDIVAQVEQNPSTADRMATVLGDGFRRACRDIHARATGDEGLAGMGCAATAILVGGSRAAMAHVGDTRLYIIRDGAAHQMSTDHTLGSELVRQGSVQADALADHPFRNVLTRTLGTQSSVDVETLLIDLICGDRLILCSDGLSGHIPSSDWLAEQVGSINLEDVPDSLTEHALRGGGQDNISVMAIGVEASHARTFERRSSQVSLDVLASSFLFGDLTLAQLTRVLERCEPHTGEPGQILIDVGDMVDGLVVVVEGRLRIEATDGRRTEATRGTHLGEAAVLRPRPSRARVAATEHCEFLVLRRDALLELAHSRPWLGVELLSRLVERLSADLDGWAGEAPLSLDPV